MSKRVLPKVGDKVPSNKFFVSKMNARVEEAFGESTEDEALSKHLLWRDIVQPFIARPEGKGYGVVIGRRRFLAKVKAKAKEFEVGKDCYIREMKDEEALDASLRENLALFRKEMNPIVRAKALSQLIDTKLTSIRGLARAWRIPNSTLVEWLQILELSPKMQGVTSKGLIYYTDALKTARLKLGKEKQDELAELVETSGVDSFKSELARLEAGKGRRGIPPGKYSIIRVTWDSKYPPDVKTLKKLSELAETKEQKIDEYVKWVLREHVKTA